MEIGVLLPLLPSPLGGCPMCGCWLWDACPFSTGFVPHKIDSKRLEAVLREPERLLGERRKRLFLNATAEQRWAIPPTLPGEHEWGAAGAAATAGASVDHHWSVLQCPYYCLLPTKAFHHDLHQQVKVYCVKPGVGVEVGFTEGKTAIERETPLLPKTYRLQRVKERWGSLRGPSRERHLECVTQPEGLGAEKEGNWDLWEQNGDRR